MLAHRCTIIEWKSHFSFIHISFLLWRQILTCKMGKNIFNFAYRFLFSKNLTRNYRWIINIKNKVWDIVLSNAMRLQKDLVSIVKCKLSWGNFKIVHIFCLDFKVILRFSQRLSLSSLFFSSRNIWHPKNGRFINLQKQPTKIQNTKILCKAGGRLHKKKIFYWKKILRGNYLLWHDCFFVKRKKYANHIHSSLSLHIQSFTRSN